MFRLILCLILLAPPPGLLAAPPGQPPRAQGLPLAPPLHPSAAFSPSGPGQARGALVWLHGPYNTDTQASPPEPAWLRRASWRGYDIWRFDRPPGQDDLAQGAGRLAAGLRALRAGGYRRIIVAGHSRGAWITLSVLAEPGLADGVAAFSPAAHGASPARRARALADFSALVHAAGHAPDTRVVLAQFTDDPLDPDPAARLAMMRAVAAQEGLKFQPYFLPAQPRGHMGVYEPAFDKIYGTRVIQFLDPEARSLVAHRRK